MSDPGLRTTDSTTGWELIWEGNHPDHEGHREALTTLGNGYLASRGALAWATADGVHYPGTYVAGLYNRLTSRVAGTAVEHESLVNLPSWLPVNFRPADGEWVAGDEVEVLSNRVVLTCAAGCSIVTCASGTGLGAQRPLSSGAWCRWPRHTSRRSS